ncbi:MAG: lipopolysaccharide assembly protein LapB [Gammaproteobacteria bacterium]|nr:lipopolysaccharide assembly protein LapB [Gammaproteobacteria bacterium]
MESLFWLLLPVAALSGWLACQRHAVNKSANNSASSSIDNIQYYRGVNFLLNDQPDKALNVFIEMLEVNSETVELHLALGHLFRQQGDVERSIRLHQNLLARPNLNVDLRAQIRLELGKDYLKAGLLDRAEQVLNEFRHDRHLNREALELLRDLYELERDWDAALSVGLQLQKKSKIDLRIPLAHYYCELAEKAFQAKDWDGVKRCVKYALGTNRQNVRANLILARAAAIRNDHGKAVEILLKIPRQDDRFVSEIVLPLADCYQQLELQDGYHKSGNNLLQVVKRLTHADILRKSKTAGTPLSTDGLVDLDEGISLAGVSRYLNLIGQQAQGDNAQIISRVVRLLDKVTEHLGSYRCELCGFSGKSLHWQCPSCREWQSVIPI